MLIIKRNFTTLCILSFLMLFTLKSFSAVVLNGTRVIYNESSGEKNIQLINNGDTPFAVQIWLDNDEAMKEANLASNFIITPQIFRIEPNSSQIVRVIKFDDIEAKLAQDRESLLSLKFSQIPASFKDNSNPNQLAVVISSNVKFFYRPKSIEGQRNLLAENLVFKQLNNKLVVENNSPFHVVIADASLVDGEKNAPLVNSVTLSPKTLYYWDLPSGKNNATFNKIKLNIINDYGASESFYKNLN